MVQVERSRSCNTDVFTQPLLITVECSIREPSPRI
jgi:hypothetical protein